MPARKPTKKDLEVYERTLRVLLAELTGDIDRLQRETLDNDSPREDSVDEGSTDGYALEISLGLLEQDESTVRDVLDALERFETGTYGACEACDDWIAKERLAALPHARHCIDCQRDMESENGRG